MSRRGQATVEAALGILVFVTVLAFGIHFAEMGYLAPKVEEAAIGAMWDATGASLHAGNLSSGASYNRRATAIRNAASAAQTRYRDFDGRSSMSGGSNRQVFTLGDGMTVNCSLTDALSPLMGDGTIDRSGYRLTLYPNAANGEMSCWSEATFHPAGFPRSFMDQGSKKFFPTRNYPPGLSDIRICGFGRAMGGNCNNGSYVMLLDDWGLSGGSESQDCTNDGTCANTDYWGLVKAVYQQTGVGSAATTFATAITRGPRPSQYAESQFMMSYSTNPDPNEQGGDADPRTWTTRVGERLNPSFRDRPCNRCFLGATRL